ncbi:MAG: M48 family metalloprotease [Desulfobulbaceae bacterium]|nr:M48 family metalloprotease [Desulfobulbaceae bacterium]
MKNNRIVLRFIAGLTLLAYTLLPLQALALTIGEERKIGEQLLFSVRKELPILEDPDISQYINQLGKSVLDIAGPQYFEYRFFVVKSQQFNAFAAPAGLVFFYTGLIETMRTEDELLSVLAHEIGHVASRHISQRMDKGTKISAISLLLGVAGLALGVPGLSQGLLMGSMAGGQAINLQYSREDEEQSDRISFGWMQKMKRNPVAMEEMLKTMRRISRYRVGGDTPQYLLTHPNPEARMGYVASLIEQDPQQKTKDFYLKTDNFAFLRFKYRVLMQSVDQEKIRVSCVNLLTTGTDKEQQTMAKYGLVLLEGENRNFDQALQYLDEVRAQYPTKDILEIDRAVMLMESGRVEEGRRLLEQAFKRNPNDMYGVYQLAKLELMRGNGAKAEQLLQRVMTVMPEYPQLYYDMGQIEADRGKEGSSIYYLGKYNLYLGREKLAKQYLTRASKDKSVPEKQRYDAKNILDKLKDLEKGI